GWTQRRSSSCASTLRTVADDRPRPLRCAIVCDETGSPPSMYSRTSVASSWSERSANSKEPITSQELRACKWNYSPLFSESPFPAHADGCHARIGNLSVLGGDELGDNAHGDLLRGDRADVQPDGCVHSLERFVRCAFLDERVEDTSDLGLAANQATVTQRGSRQRAERIEIVRVPARDDDGVGGWGKSVRCDPLRNVVHDDVDAFAEALGAGEFLAVVDDMYAEADFVRQLRHKIANVPGAEDIHVR